MSLALRAACPDDLRDLARMNKQLIEDEGSENLMDLAALQDRMREWMHSDWRIDLLVASGTVVGYAVYRFRPHPYMEDVREVYLRQYFIRRECRRAGYGSQGIELLCRERFKGAETVVVDVLAGNTPGVTFWGNAGFATFVLTKKRKLR